MEIIEVDVPIVTFRILLPRWGADLRWMWFFTVNEGRGGFTGGGFTFTRDTVVVTE